ncbi:uncharacterized protein [Oscarella lobularis]|uniref:uncharacterized protein isoform X2 n=1 Tax=Oscarella lobularis TaxID=121494 RepID=UPI00331415C4
MSLFEAPLVGATSFPLFLTLLLGASVARLDAAEAWSDSLKHIVTVNCTNQLVLVNSAVLDCCTSHCNSSKSALDVVRTACQYRRYCQVVASNVTFETNCTGEIFLNISYECVEGLNDTVLPPFLLQVKKSSAKLRWHPTNHQSIQETRIQRRYVPMSQPCAVPGFLFEGFGYVHLAQDQFIGGEEFKIKLFFRTANPDGILFAAFKSDASLYVYLALIDGQLKFRVECEGNNKQSIETDKTWNDNRFYRVEAVKTNENIILQVVTGNRTNLFNTSIKCGKTFVVHSSYIGGPPTDASLKSSLPTLLSDRIGFIGCIRVMFLHDKNAEFNSSKVQKLVNVVQENGGCPPSFEKAMHFRGSGYVKLGLSSSSQINEKLHFRFRIRTSWPNGLLLAAFRDASKDFLFVETRGRDGIDVRYRTNEERVNIIRANRCVLCDGSWHEIGLLITNESFTVRIDNEKSKELAHTINVREFASEILQNVYLGGMPQYNLSETRPTPVEVALGFGVNVTRYGGCLADFSVNETSIDVVKKREDSVKVSFAGCPDFPWSGPICEEQLMDINSANKEDRTVTDTKVEAFTEYLYRVVAKVSGGGVVFSEWITVRTGKDSSSSGRFLPQIDYDGMKATIRWAGPPTVLRDDDESYDIYILYACTVCSNTTISPCYHWNIENTTLPYQLSSVTPSTMYTVKISASVLNRRKKLTSNFSTPVQRKAHSNVCECNKDERECDFSFVYDEKECSGWSNVSFNTSWCSTKPDAIQTTLEWSSSICPAASSLFNHICPPPSANFTTNSSPSVISPSSSPIRPSAAVNSTTETTSSFGLPDAYLVGTGIGCFLVVIGVGFFFYWKKKRAPAASSNRNGRQTELFCFLSHRGPHRSKSLLFYHLEVQMTATVSSPLGENNILLTRNDYYSLQPPLSRPPLPPPNETVYSEIDCIEKRDDAPFDAVNLGSEQFAKSLNVYMSRVGVNTADVKNDRIDYEDPIPDDETEMGFTAASISVFWEPAKTEETLRNQLAEAKVRLLKSQFGTVEKGIWTKDQESSIVVAVKTLKSDTGENRVKFFREAAIRSQFEHNNVIKMYGVVLSENPIMILEMLPKGDLTQFLLTTRYEKAALKSNLAACFLEMSRGIAAGMTYLAGLSFIHRDLAARNVLLDQNLVCKIADFGLARDFDEEDCYMGRICIRWTAPEVLKFFTYSLASDVWSYGVVLYEIWSVGEQPYDCLSNKMVVENLEMGYRLPPPPGCPYAIYKLMIECWHPDDHKRPSFSAVSTCLSEPDDALLINEETSEPISGKIGDCVEESCQTAYLDLQSVYKSQ